MKKLTAILLAMVLSLAGCASGEASTTENPAAQVPATVPSVTEEPTAAVSEEAEAALMTYEAFLAAEPEDRVCVETCVQGSQSWWDNKITLYCQDADGAYFLYDLNCSEEDAERLVPGTRIRVTGDKAVLNGRNEILNGSFEFLENGEPFVAEPLEVTEFLGTDTLASHQNKLVAFREMTVEAVADEEDAPGDDLLVTLSHNGISVDFYVESYLTDPDSEVYRTVETLEAGDIVNVEGFLYWHDGARPHITTISLAE